MKIGIPYRISHVVWLNGIVGDDLDELEGGLMSRIIKKSRRGAEAAGLATTYNEIYSKAQFLGAVHSLVERIIEHDAYPLLHLDFHGSAKNGLVFQDNSSISWKDLSDQLRKINDACHHNLVVFAAVCCSSKIIENIDYRERLPFYALFSRPDQLCVSLIEDALENAYRSLGEKHPLFAVRDAFEHAYGAKMDSYYSEELVVEVLARSYQMHYFEGEDYDFEEYVSQKFLYGRANVKILRENVLQRKSKLTSAK